MIGKTRTRRGEKEMRMKGKERKGPLGRKQGEEKEKGKGKER